MLENSVLNNKIIKKILNDYYEIKVNSIKRINKGSACVYNIDDKYILKEFPSDRDVNTIEKEYKVITYLASKDLIVPEYILTKDNENHIIYKGKIIIIQKFIKGYILDNNTGNFEETMLSAKKLGELSKALEDYQLDDSSYIFPRKEDLEEDIGKLKKLKDSINEDNPYKEKIKEDLEYKIIVCEKLKNLNFDNFKKVSIKVCHGDYSVQQLIFTKDDVAIIDFETIKNMPIVWEIIRSYSYIDKDAKFGEFNLDTFVKYVKKIMEYIDLSKEDLIYMPYIYILQLIGSSFGYKQYNNDYSKKDLLDFAFFRTNLCKYLYENLDKVSKELLKIHYN